MKKLLDLRFVIGAFFTVVGALLLIYYFMKASEVLPAAMVNAWCGIVFMLFGLGMITLSYVQKLGDE
jgi:hypothetical protein